MYFFRDYKMTFLSTVVAKCGKSYEMKLFLRLGFIFFQAEDINEIGFVANIV